MLCYENRAIKAVEIVLRRGRRLRESSRGVNLIQVCCMEILQ
jgi:hypothetical protein